MNVAYITPEQEPGKDRPGRSDPQWLDSKNWPVPQWISNPRRPGRVRDFDSYSALQLRSRYVELEGDFRTVVANFPPHDQATADYIFVHLQSARPALEHHRPQLRAVSNILDLIERYMVWIIPIHLLHLRLTSTIVKLETVRPEGWQRYIEQLKNAKEPRAALDEAIGALNQHVLNASTANGLQIYRLRTYRNWSIVILLIMIGATPFLAQSLTHWPEPVVSVGYLAPWIPAFSILIVGALGGFISGLLQVKSSRVTLVDYQESMETLSLRPLLGGLVSLVLFVLLSWNVFPSIKPENAGTYLLVAFLSGFSERYFLRLIDVEATRAATADSLSQSGSSPIPAGTRTSPGVATATSDGDVMAIREATAAQGTPDGLQDPRSSST